MSDHVLLRLVILVLAAPLGLFALARVRRRPQVVIPVLVGLAAFDGLLIIVPHPGLVEGWKEGLVVLFLLAALVAPASARRPPDLAAWVPLAAPVLGFALVAGASAVWVGGVQGVIGLKLDVFYAALPLGLFLCPLSARERDGLVGLLMGLGVVTAVVGVLQQVLGAEFLVSLGYEYDVTVRTAGGLLRAFSTFNQPFPFAFFLMLVLLVGLATAAAEPGRLRNRLFLLSVPLLVVAMLTAIVRAAVLGFLVGALFLWWHRYRRLAHLVAPAMAGLVLVPVHVYGALLSSSSLGERSSGWSQTVGRVVDAPLGNGVGSTGSAAEKAVELGAGVLIYQPDNYYFKTAYELGPLGLWMLLLLGIATARLGVVLSRRRQAEANAPGVSAEGRRQHARDAALAAGIVATVLAGAAAALVSSYLEIFPIDLLFWLFLGVLPSLTTGSSSPPSRSDRAAAASRPTPASSPVR